MFVVRKEAELPAARPTASFSDRLQYAALLAAHRMRELWSIEQLERAIAHRNSVPFVTDSRWRVVEHQLHEVIDDALRQAIGEAGGAELARLEREQVLRKAEIRGAFNLRNPFTEDYVRRSSARLVQGITTEARETIRDTIEAGFVHGVPVRTTARELRETLGLDARLARAVQRQIRTMTDAGSPDDVVEKQAQAYANRLIAYRAEMIARTETMAASNQGVLDSWRQASREGLLPGGMLKRWIHADGSARTCPICEGLGASDPIGVDDSFVSDVTGESYERPPAHPHCRCTIGLVRP